MNTKGGKRLGVVLSVIGTILLKILELLLILILIVIALLFLPIRYRFDGSYKGELKADIRVSWLCHLVSFRIKIEEATSMKFRLFGVDMAKFIEKTKAQKERRRKRKAKKRSKYQSKEKARKKSQAEKLDTSGKTDIEIAQVEKKQDILEGDKDNEIPLLEEEKSKEEPNEGIHSETIEVEKSPESHKKSKRKRAEEQDNIFVTIKKRLEKIIAFFKFIPKLFLKIKDKVAWTKEVRVFIAAENTKRMVCILKDNMIHLWRKLKPKRLKANVYFGTGDPATTGQILGVISILYAYYGASVEVRPDFENARLEGKLYFRGRVSLITIIMIGIRLLLSKEWNQFRRDAERLKEAF